MKKVSGMNGRRFLRIFLSTIPVLPGVFLIFLFLFSAQLRAEQNLVELATDRVSVIKEQQGKTVNGTIVDQQGEPIIGANVIEKGTTNGTVTDFDGNFTLSVEEAAVLNISYIGYLEQEINTQGKTSFNIVLKEDTKTLDELVVVGYGVQKKVNMTGSVSSIDFAEQAESRPMTNVSSSLAGLSSGVSVRQGVGKPGEDGASIRIRGLGTLNDNNPLILIDGMEGILDSVNPSDIESISVLKDAASASIYGSRAANGVILVTTKRGNRDKTTVTYNANFSMSSPSNAIDFVSDYPRYMSLINESALNLGMPSHFSQSTIDAWTEANKNPNGLNENGIPNRIAFPNTNWTKEVYENNIVQNHNLSVSGGSKKASYLLSAGYLDNPGLVENTGLKRYNLRINLESNITDWLTVGTSTYAIQQDKESGNYDQMHEFMRQSSPGVYGRYNGEYGYPEAPEENPNANNLFATLNSREGDDRSSRFNTTLFSSVKFMEGLSWDFNFNYARRIDEINYHTNAIAGRRVRLSDGLVMRESVDPSQMTTTYKTWANETYTIENLLKYNVTIKDKHDISALLGYNQNKYFAYDHTSTKKGLIDQSVSTPGSATEMVSIGGGALDYSIRSFFGRLNYGYMQKYLFEANFRYDGSSRFHEDQRWGIFPSFSGAWRLSEEEFFSNLKSSFENVKIRASWGQLGNNATQRGDDIDNYAYQSVYGDANYSFGGTQVAGLRPTIIANPYLEWESTTMTNIGLDVTTLDSRLSAEIDYYYKLTDGILTVPPIYLTNGLIGAPIRNTAEIMNKGIDLNLTWRDKIGKVSYSVSGNFSYNQNEVTNYKGKLSRGWITDSDGNEVYITNLGDVSSGGLNRILEGHTINEYYMHNLYSGSGNHFNSDGSVNINGGPKNGMIRTEDDMKWINAMVEKGYKFLPNEKIQKDGIWYGDYIYADRNGDGIYGNSLDQDFTGSSSMPKYNFGLNMYAKYENFDISMLWSGQAGFDLYWNEHNYNNTNTRVGYQISEHIANDHYFFSGSADDPRNNINAEYPRLKMSESDPQNMQNSNAWLYNGSYVKLKNITLGYTLPEHIANKIYTQKVRLYFSAENLLTITSYPGVDPEMGGNTSYPLMRQLSFGANITF